MKGYSSFYEEFYGPSFARHFRRPSYWKTSRIQYTVTTPRMLYRHVHKNSGIHPCFVSIYDYGTFENLKNKNKDKIYLDRLYFDFDVHHTEAEALSYILKHLKTKGPNYSKNLQNKLKNRLKYLIINEKIAKPAIDEAKKFAMLFKESFDKEPALFFSGSKGCHAYCFMEPVKLDDPNGTISDFAELIKRSYNFKTLDLAVNKDALSRLSRIPYSKHQLTGLTVVPFNTTDSYDEIISKSLKPVIEPFNIQDHLTKLDEHLKSNDKILRHNKMIKIEIDAEKQQQAKKYIRNIKISKIEDHRKFFKKILGEPAKEYEHYNMYNCPFTHHSDDHPSFMVYKSGYTCKGCNMKGNYWQFLKDYYGWTNSQVKEYLKEI